MQKQLRMYVVLSLVLLVIIPASALALEGSGQAEKTFDQQIDGNAQQMVMDGRQIFRFDTFGDEAFWGDTLQLHQAIQGAAHGGVGPGVSPKTALSVGLKVDVDALPAPLVEQLKQGKVNLDDPATTLALIKLNAVVGITGTFNAQGNLTSMGTQCALCHSTVDNSLTFGIGHRLDGWANRDLNVGAIIALAPNLKPVANLLGVEVVTVTKVLGSWGPGKFDAELFLDGKAFNPQQVTDGITVTNVSGATLLPNAFGLAGYNQHTWTGAWGTVPYWNAFVAILEMHGKGTFYDPRLDNAAKYPVAAANKFGHIVSTDPMSDMVTSKLPALQFYQLAIPAPKPTAGVDFDKAAAARGDLLFSGKAKCGTCHVKPLWTEPGWNLHTPAEIGIDSFQADRAPDGMYKTMNLAGVFVRERGLFMDPANKGRFYHDGRFATLRDVVKHYNTFLKLGLSDAEMLDLVEYLKSL